MREIRKIFLVSAFNICYSVFIYDKFKYNNKFYVGFFIPMRGEKCKLLRTINLTTNFFTTYAIF